MMERIHSPYLMSFTLVLLMHTGILSSATAAESKLSTRAQAKAFFDEYFEHYDKGKVPPRGPSSFREADKDAFDYLCDALKNKKHRDLAIRTLGYVTTKENVLPHLYPFLKDEDEDIRATTAVALGRRGKPEATERLIPLLKDPVDFVVRVTADAIGNCGGKDAAGALIDLYRNGETHDWWGYHIKNEILMSLAQLRAREALPLCYEELDHKNLTIFRSVISLMASAVKNEEDRKEAGKKLLDYAQKNTNPKKAYSLVKGLGYMKYAAAIPYIRSVYRKPPAGNYVVAEALANISTPECASKLMKIYLSTGPLSEMTCLVGEPIGPCLSGLGKISGKNFGDDRKKWKQWYDLYAKKHNLGKVSVKPDVLPDADKPPR